MCVIVSLKFALDATTTTISHMESQIEEAGRAAMQAALKQAIQAAEGQQNNCPRCGSDQCHLQGTKRRVLLTRFGRVEVPLKRLRCQACRHLFRPAERCLAEVKGHNVTPALRDLAALVGSSWPSDPVAGMLKRLRGMPQLSTR